MPTPPDADPDTLSGFDLSAWDAPPPPAGLADAVVARMAAPPPAPVAPRSWVTIGAAAIATLVAGAALAVIVLGRTGEPARVAAAPPPRVTLAAGGGVPAGDDARERALEKRIEDLEAEVGRLEALVERSAHPQEPAPPAAVSPSPSRVASAGCDPFASVHGCVTAPAAPAVAAPPPPAPVEAAMENPFDVAHGPVPAPEPERLAPVDPFASPHYTPPPCDADQLVRDGTDAVSESRFADALAKLEAALRCRPGDDHAERLAFLAACDGVDAPAARRHYAALTPDARDLLIQICMRNHIDPRQAPPSGPATIEVGCTPPAHILVDGADTGQQTPARLSVAPGKHRITFAIGGDKYTWPVSVQPGDHLSLVKDLR